MPREQSLERDDGGHFCRKPPSQSLGFGGQPTALVVAESKPLVTELFAKDPRLLTKVVNDRQLALVQPAGDSRQEESE